MPESLLIPVAFHDKIRPFIFRQRMAKSSMYPGTSPVLPCTLEENSGADLYFVTRGSSVPSMHLEEPWKG